jgi:hypothetical protein
MPWAANEILDDSLWSLQEVDSQFTNLDRHAELQSNSSIHSGTASPANTLRMFGFS